MRWVSNANGIRQRDFDGTSLSDRDGHFNDALVGHFTFEWTAKGRRNGALRRMSFGMGKRDNGLRCLDRFVAALALIGHRKCIGCNCHRPQLVNLSCSNGAFCATQVHDQTYKRDIIPIRQPSTYIFRIRHLRNALWVHKTGHLNTTRAGIDGPVYQRQLILSRNQYSLILQAIARSNFDKINMVRNAHHDVNGIIVYKIK